MLENIGNVVTGAVVSPPPGTPANTGATGVDSIKIAGAIPKPPAGDITRVVFGEWLGKVIPWLRLWSKELANAVVECRDNPNLNQVGLQGRVVSNKISIFVTFHGLGSAYEACNPAQ